MSNMSYCQFQNTTRALHKCVEYIGEFPTLTELQGDEFRSAIHLIQMCRDVADQFEGVDLQQMWKDHK